MVSTCSVYMVSTCSVYMVSTCVYTLACVKWYNTHFRMCLGTYTKVGKGGCYHSNLLTGTLWCMYGVHCVHYGVCMVTNVYTMVYVWRPLCTLWCMYGDHCVHYGVCMVTNVYTMVYVWCALCTLWCMYGVEWCVYVECVGMQ